MTSRQFAPVVGFFDVVASAIAAAAATNSGRRPKSRDLRALGIDPVQFRNIGRF